MVVIFYWLSHPLLWRLQVRYLIFVAIPDQHILNLMDLCNKRKTYHFCKEPSYFPELQFPQLAYITSSVETVSISRQSKYHLTLQLFLILLQMKPCLNNLLLFIVRFLNEWYNDLMQKQKLLLLWIFILTNDFTNSLFL
jgi:hypothetical protein